MLNKTSTETNVPPIIDPCDVVQVLKSVVVVLQSISKSNPKIHDKLNHLYTFTSSSMPPAV